MTVLANRRSVMTLFSSDTDPDSHRTRIVLAEKESRYEKRMGAKAPIHIVKVFESF